MFYLHFHVWTKWKEFKKTISEHFHPLEKMNWYAKTITHLESWEKRECKICGKHQERKIK
jgi:hypothetical protein